MTATPAKAVSKDSSTTTSYTVVAGDTLYNIAQSFGITLQALYDANPQLNGSSEIFPGQVLSIPGQAVSNPGTTNTYTVVAGDTLSKIAASFGITLQALRDANPQLDGGDLIEVGQVLNIPSGTTTTTTYTVVAGDTLYNIAQAFGITLQALRDANPQLQGSNLIVPGQVLTIPSGGTPPPPPPVTGIPYYSGPASAFPPMSQWIDFTDLWNQNAPTMLLSNIWPGNTEQQNEWIQQAIIQVAADSVIVDERLILAVVMQESQGHVHVPTTNNGVINPGLMQSHDGVAYSDADPQGSIIQMIRDGTLGTATGDGLRQLIAGYGNPYEALRAYNSGKVNQANLSDGLGATPSYVSDCTNRLLGVVPN